MMYFFLEQKITTINIYKKFYNNLYKTAKYLLNLSY